MLFEDRQELTNYGELNMKSGTSHIRKTTNSNVNQSFGPFAAILALAMITAFNPIPSSAQEVQNVLEEVIVTAEKRQSTAQETAISLSVFSESELAKRGVASSMDLQSVTPSLIFGSIGGFGMPYIRGIGNDFLTIASDASTSMYVDGVYYARSGGSIQEIFDVERVEILKGPQGTLYGRNSVGGSINIITRKPDENFGGHADVIIGNNEKQKFRSAINVPLTGNLFMRGSAVFSKSQGFFRNLTPASESIPIPLINNDDHYGGDDVFATRVNFRYVPADNLELTLGIDYSRDRTARTNVFNNIQGFLSPAIDFDRDVPDAGLPGPLDTGATPGHTNPDPYLNYLNVYPNEDQRQKGVNLTINWDLDFATLKSISSYRKFDYDSLFDLDGTDYPDGRQRFLLTSKTFTQELQLTSNPSNESLQWVAGLFYLDDKGSQKVPVSLAHDQELVNFNADLNAWAWAAYGQASYNFTDKMRLTAGIRYSEEKKKVFYDHTITLFPGTLDIVIPIGLRDSKKWTSWDPKVGFDYTLNDEMMLYANVSKAFKSGGFNNLSLDATSQRYDPEKIIAYEVGLKSELFDRRVRANFAAFFYDYTDLQQNQYDAAAVVVVNADSAEIKGIDVDLTALVTEGLELNLAVSYLDATFKKFITFDPDNLAAGFQDLGALGNRLTRSPKWAYNANATYTHSVGDKGSLEWFAEYVWKDDVFHSPFNQDGIGQSAFGLANASVTWRSPGEHWSVSVWGKNLGDKTWYQNSIRNTAFAGAIGLVSAPRAYGISVSTDW